MQLTLEHLSFYLNQCENKRLSWHTLKAYRIDLKQFYSFMMNKDMNKREISYYIHYLNHRFKPKTVKRKLASLHAFFEDMVFYEIIQENPMDKMRYKIQEEKTLPRIIQYHQLQDLFHRLDQDQHFFIKRDKAVIELLISTGIRVSELCAIKNEDIYLEEKYLIVYGKNTKERVIFLGEEVYLALKEYEQAFHDRISQQEYFFINNQYHRLTDQSVRHIINRYTDDFHITPHMFRHTFATMLLEQDVDISYIQKILGHSSITTTSIYAYASIQRQKEIMMNKNPRQLIK